MSHRTALCGVLAGVFSGVSVVDCVDAQTSYTTVTNTQRSVTNFNAETVRGLAWDGTAGRLYAINTHGSRLMYFQPGTGSGPIASWPTLNNPVSLALFDDDNGQPRVLVVGGGTHGAAVHDRNTGEIVDFVKLPSEPMDVVVDGAGTHAFISCGGAFDRPIVRVDGSNHFESGGAVVELHLAGSYDGLRTHFIPAARPMFLSLDEGGPGLADDLILVASHLSGNGTTWRNAAALNNAEAEVVRTDPSNSLPDEDIFSIDASSNVAPYLSGMGTLLTAHGRNPATDEYWVLGVESLNHEEVTEPAHRGKFAQNRAMRVDTTSGTSTVESFDAVTDTASFPWGLGFHPDPMNGHAFVTSSTGDLVRVMTSTGALVRNVGLPEGAIPRSILVDANNVFVYAWGRNEVYRFDTNAMTSPLPAPAPIVETFDLGFDPAPAAVKAGREIWYDAHRSEDPVDIVGAQRVTCNTCHPRGGMDLLAWQLSDKPVDDKDVMVTQSLFGIEDTFPYHWRGERTLSDFNGAFSNLLGGEDLDPDELADFEAFVFSLQGAANPRQHIDRVLDDSLRLEFVSKTSLGGSGDLLVGRPGIGQTEFHTADNALGIFNPIRCVDCHGAESGTNGLITGDVLSFLPAQIQSDVAHLRQLGHKLFQPRFDVDALGGGSLDDRTRGGFGLSQDGDDPDLLEFLNTPQTFFTAAPGAPPDVVDASVQQQVDACSFVMQFDEGIAPRAHHALWYDGSVDADDDLSEMLSQAKSAWIDLVVFARTSTGVTFGMWFDRSGLVFRTAKSTTPGVLNLTPAALTGLYTPPGGPGLTLFFMGVPPGNGFRVAVDPDNDDVSAQLEIAYGMNPERAESEPAGQEDGWPDGYELALWQATGLVSPLVFNTDGQIASADTAVPSIVDATRDHVTARASKHYVSFTEPVRYSTQPEQWNGTGYTPVGQVRPFGPFRRFDTIVGHGYRPGESYRLRVDMVDLVGRRNTQYLYDSDYVGGVPATPIVNVATKPQFFQTVIPSPALKRFVTSNMNVVPTGNPGEFQVTVDVEALVGSPTNETVIFQVIWRNGADWEIVPIADLTAVGPTRIEPMMEFGVNYWGSGGASAVQSYPNTEGPFVFAEPIASGSASATLQLTGYSGVECRVVVLGVFTEISPPAPGLTNQFEPLDNMQWQMPMSPNSGRRFDFTP